MALIDELKDALANQPTQTQLTNADIISPGEADTTTGTGAVAPAASGKPVVFNRWV